MIHVNVAVLPHGEGLPLPAYATAGAAGMDLFAAVDTKIIIARGERALIPTGLAMAIPEGFEAQLRPRSGLAYKHGITVLNAPGTIDCDYRGEIKALLINHGNEPFAIERAMRIAQLVFAPVTRAKLEAVDNLDETVRGTGGYGSTGMRIP